MVLHNLLLTFAFLDCGLDGAGRDKRVFWCAKRLERPWDTPRLLFSGFLCFRPEVKRLESDKGAIPSRIKFLNYWSYTSAPFICLHGLDMIKVSSGTYVTLYRYI
jgi:hypothetical protein